MLTTKRSVSVAKVLPKVSKHPTEVDPRSPKRQLQKYQSEAFLSRIRAAMAPPQEQQDAYPEDEGAYRGRTWTY